MTQATDRPAADGPGETARRMRAIAAGLNAAGLDVHLHQTCGVPDISATVHRPGHKPVEIVYDEDDYAQISYRNDPGATPAQAVAVISRALTVITRRS
jgi:hypothetical protein